MNTQDGPTRFTMFPWMTSNAQTGLVADRPAHHYGTRPISFQTTKVAADSLRPADRISHTQADGLSRHGTVVRVYSEEGVPRFDVLWDEPGIGNPAPWRGASHGLAVAVFDDSAWEILHTRSNAGDWRKARKLLFPFGRIVATPAALDMLHDARAQPWIYLLRHVSGDWGNLDPDDLRANEDAIFSGARVFSAYTISDNNRLWIITEADRSVTTLLLPNEY